MTEEEWLACGDLEVMLRLFRTKRSSAIDRKLRLFAAACCHRISPLLLSARSVAAIKVVEDLIEGKATEEQRQDAHQSAGTAYQELNVSEGFDSPQSNASFATWSACANDAPWLVGYTIIDAAFYAAKGAAGACDSPAAEKAAQIVLCRDVFGNPFRPASFSDSWRTDTAVTLARQMYDSREFSAMPILADAIQDAGCDSDDILAHCRDVTQLHVRGCWVCDLVLGKE